MKQATPGIERTGQAPPGHRSAIACAQGGTNYPLWGELGSPRAVITPHITHPQIRSGRSTPPKKITPHKVVSTKAPTEAPHEHDSEVQAGRNRARIGRRLIRTMTVLSALVGGTYGRLTVISLERSYCRALLVRCRCECGQECVIPQREWKMRQRASCGCLERERRALASRQEQPGYKRAHGAWRSLQALVPWVDWPSFEEFHAALGDCPEGHWMRRRTLERPWGVGNVEWAPRRKRGAAGPRQGRGGAPMKIEATSQASVSMRSVGPRAGSVR